MNTLKKTFKFLTALMALLAGVPGSFAQTTIVNYDFNTGTSYATLTPSVASHVFCTPSSTEAWQTYTGIASGAGAFTTNATAGNALGMANSSGTNTRYFQFQLAGPALSSYSAYRIYCQAQRAATGATSLTIAYSTNGTSYTNFATTQSPGNGSFAECTFDLSAITAINAQATVYFRIMASGASGSGTLAIDNLQFRACTAPVITISNPTPLICPGTSATLTATGATSYTWSPGGATTSSISVNPPTTTLYTVTGFSAGCTGTQTTTINIDSAPPVSISNPTSTICAGSSTTLTASGATSYVWNPGGATTASISVSPSSTTVYTVTGTASGYHCALTVTTAVTVNALPTVSASATSSIICSGNSTTLTAGGASTYTWSPGGATTTSISVTPSVTTVYTVSGTSAAGCINTKTISITVNATPTIAISNPTPSICAGSSTTLTASGASTYVWNPGGATTASISVSPASTTVYTVTGTSAAGCTKTQTTTVTVNALPTLSVSPTATTICSGNSTTLTASGASTYTWSPGGLNSASVSVSPGTTTTYTVTGKNAAGCVNTKTVTVTVNPTPTVTISNPTPTICTGGSATLTASGASSYKWSPGSIISVSIAVTPSVTSGYTVQGTSAAGCISVSFATVTVAVPPSISISAASSTICAGSSTTLTASGASTYTWSPGGLNTASISVSPGSTTVYTVTGASAVGCVNTKTISITVNPLPTVAISNPTPAICTGNSTTLTASGASTYFWSPGGATTASVSVSPTTTTVYTVTGISAAGCAKTQTTTVTVYALPSVSVSASSPTVCTGVSATLTASGASTYTWSTGPTTTSVSVSPTVTTTYTLTGTDSHGCVNTATQTITPNNTLQAHAGYDRLIVAPNTTTIGGWPASLGGPAATAMSGIPPYTYSWTPNTALSPNNTSANPVASPVATTIYSLTVTDSHGCQSRDEVVVYLKENEEYYVLKSVLNGHHYLVPPDDTLRFTIDGEYDQMGLSYSIVKDVDNTPASGLSFSVSTPLLSYGDNRYSIGVASLPASYYVLSVKNQKNEIYYLRFKR